MIIADLSTKRRRDIVLTMLPAVLQDLTAPASTSEVVSALARRLEVGRDELALLARLVTSVAPLFPEAVRSSASFHRYGREMRPWIWSPRGGRKSAEDWSVPASLDARAKAEAEAATLRLARPDLFED